MGTMSQDFIQTVGIIIKSLGFEKAILWIKAYYFMMPLTTVFTIAGVGIASWWIVSSFSRTKSSFNPKMLDEIIDEQKHIVRKDQAENIP